MSLLYLNQLYVEDKSSEWRYLCTSTTLTICKVIRDEEAILSTFLHKLHTLCPTCDNLIQAESSWLVTLIRTVKNSTINQCSLIMTYYLVCS